MVVIYELEFYKVVRDCVESIVKLVEECIKFLECNYLYLGVVLLFVMVGFVLFGFLFKSNK